MSKRQHATGREEFTHQDNNSSKSQRFTKPNRNFTWRREPVPRDRTTRFPTALDPTASSIVTDPAARHPYRFRAHGTPQYDSGSHVYSPNEYGAYGVPSHGYGNHVYPSRGFGAHYPPSHGSSDHYARSHGSRPHYPPRGVRASDPPSYGVRAPGHLSYSHGVEARSLRSHGSGVHDFPSYGVGAVAPSPKFPAVSLRGLPSNCREVDIIQFFDGLYIVDVFLIFIRNTFSGKAVVVFSNSNVADSALQRNKQKLGNASVEIYTCRRWDYYDAVAAAVNDGVDFGNPLAQTKSLINNNLVEHTHDVVADLSYHVSPQGQATRLNDNNVVNQPHKRRSDAVADSKLHGRSESEPENILHEGQAKEIHHILKVRGPACLVDRKVIIDFFGECNLSEGRVHSLFHPDGKPTGEILLGFTSQEDAEKAMSKDKTMIGSDLIEIIPSTLEDLQIINFKQRQESDCHNRVKDSNDKELMGADSHSHSKPKRYNDKEQKVYTQILKIRNVPPSADMHDIIEFFGEFNLTLDSLQVVCGRDGIATGEIYVEFDSIEDAKKAISKDKKTILSQCVELFPSSPNEAGRAMSGSW